MRRLTALVALLAASLLAQGISLEGLVGTASPIGSPGYRANWSVHALYRFDQMVLFGPGFGYEGLPGRPAGVADGKLQVRLPIGRQLMPYMTVEAGAGLRPHLEDSYFLWRGGGGADLKLGDRSSLLAECGWAAFGRYYGRLGLLLDF
jgi:hypothetical protein